MEKQTPRQLPTSLDVALAKADLPSRRLPPGSANLFHNIIAAHAELAANGVVHCLPCELPEIHRRDEEQERKDRLVTVHTFAIYGYV